MAKIFDYKCTFLDNVQIDDSILNEAQITFPNVHKEAKLIVDYAKLVKKITNEKGSSSLEITNVHI